MFKKCKIISRLVICILAIILCFSFVACGKSNDPAKDDPSSITNSNTNTGNGGNEGSNSGNSGGGGPSIPPITPDPTEWMTVENGDECSYTVVNPYLYDDGINTLAQTSDVYNANLALPSDSMMVFGLGYDQIESQIKAWVNTGAYKQIDIFLPLGRDHDSYYIKGHYDGKNYENDIVQRYSDGTPRSHPSGDTYYVFPSDGFAEFLAKYAIKAIEAGAKDVYFEEPDGFTDSVYCEHFKWRFADHYGVSFMDPNSSVQARYMVDALIGTIWAEAMDIISTKIKEVYPDSNVYLCTHSSFSYQKNPISSNNVKILQQSGVDGIVGQAWTDTTSQAVKYDGVAVEKPFEVGYAEYSELKSIQNATKKKFYSLSDPSADTPGLRERARPIYEQNVVSQLLQPDISYFQLSIWPDRSFGNADDAYKQEQQGIFTMMNEIAGKQATRIAGTAGVAVLMSYNAVSNKDVNNINNYIVSIVSPLLEQGIPCDVLLLEALTPDLLKNYNTIIGSYNYIKPEKAEQHTYLRDFVNQGGSLIWLGAEDRNSSVDWFWNDAGFALPKDHLFNQLQVSQTESFYNSTLNLTTTSDAPSYFSNITSNKSTDFAEISSQSNGKTILRNNNKSVLVLEQFGNGNLLRFGVDTDGMVDDAVLREVFVKATRYGIELAGEKYSAPKYLMTYRGDYTIVKTYDTTVQLEGTYINIFDDNLTVQVNPTVEKNSYGLYKKLSEDGNAYVFYSNSRDVVVEEVNDMFVFETKTIYQSDTVLMISLPYVNYVSVEIKDSIMNTDISFTESFDETTRMLKLKYKHSVFNKIKVSIQLDYS